MFNKLKERFRFNKENLNEIRFKLKYLYLPIYIVFNLLDFILCGVFLVKLNDPLIIVFLLLFLSLASTGVFIVYVRKVKEKEILIEAEKLKTFFSEDLMNNPVCEYVLPADDGLLCVDLTFCDDGIQIGNLKYSFDGFDCALYTSNFMYQVNLILMFSRNEKGDLEDGDNNGVSRFTLPLNLNLISIMNKFKLNIKNPDVLKFIKDNPILAAAQILEYGKIQHNYREEKEGKKGEKNEK